MCIQMLEILNTGRVYKISELANILDTNPRNVVEYKRELEECGYYISSIPGRYGGYQLDKNYVIPALKLVPAEKESIIEAFNYAMTKKDFLKKSVFSSAVGKISSSIQLPELKNDLLVVDHYQLSMSEEEIEERYKFVEKAIKDKRVIEIEYQSIKNGYKKHELHPYKLFIYNNSWFFLAWNPEAGDVWYFKLNRMAKWKMLEQHFRIWKSFKAEDYFDGNGFKNNGEFIHTSFIAKGIRKHLIKERVYGKNQTITELEDGSIKVKLDMQNEDQIISFILSCGVDVILLEPHYLVERIKSTTAEIQKLYEKEEKQ